MAGAHPTEGLMGGPPKAHAKVGVYYRRYFTLVFTARTKTCNESRTHKTYNYKACTLRNTHTSHRSLVGTISRNTMFGGGISFHRLICTRPPSTSRVASRRLASPRVVTCLVSDFLTLHLS